MKTFNDLPMHTRQSMTYAGIGHRDLEGFKEPNTCEPVENVMVSLFTGFGALIAQEMVGVQNAGAHTHSFDLSQMPAGSYIVKVTTGGYREAKSINIFR